VDVRPLKKSNSISGRFWRALSYAEPQLIIAESKGKISHQYLQFIASQKGDIESRYITNKGLLPPDVIEDM